MSRRHIYFAVADNGKIKIGSTGKPIFARFQQLEKQHQVRLQLIGSIFGSYVTEKLIQKALAPYCLHGEWFRDCTDVRLAIADLIRRGPFFDGLPQSLLRKRSAA
jgi:hypothetical protein